MADARVTETTWPAHGRVSSEDDGFPARGALSVLGHLPRYGRLAWNLSGDPALPAVRRAAVVAAVGYLVSPIDLVPGIIPAVGQLDDLVVIVLGVHFALAGLDPQRRLDHLDRVGMREQDLESDLHNLRRSGRWAARRAGSALAAVMAAGQRRAAPAIQGVTSRLGRSAAEETS
jgi:uncharacterized membrane protein YkvA (DUF1232 family)